MTKYLRQSTTATRVIGQFVDSTDGVTPKTALTIAQSDIRLSKNGGTFAQSHNSAGATSMEEGYYSVPLDATDTSDLGLLDITITVGGAFGVRDTYEVLPAPVFDAFVSGSVDFPANCLQWNSHAVNEVVSGSPVVTLGAAQAAYAPAKAGDAMTLEADQAVNVKKWNSHAVNEAVNGDPVCTLDATAVTALSSAVWDKLLTNISQANSIGKLIQDTSALIDAKISSRLSTADADDLENAVEELTAALSTLQAIQTQISQIKTRTDGLPVVQYP